MLTTTSEVGLRQEQQDDNMAEMASRTDDEDGILSAAFDHLHKFAEEDDEIVWDLR
jgi:hypothetical protein